MAEKKEGNIFSRIGRFFKDMIGELKKVVWPSKKQVVNNTAIVLVFMFLASVVVSGFDALLGVLRRFIFAGGAK